MSEQTAPRMKGGTKDFNWDDVRYMSYKDRESYLGYTVKIGFLDKGGRWKKRDWWRDKRGKRTKEEMLRDEVQKEKDEDEKRMRIALGLEEKEETYELPKMTGEEARYVTQKMKKEAEEEFPDDLVEKMPGLGFKLNANLGKKQKILKDNDRALRLDGYGIEEIEKEKKKKEKELIKLKEKSKKERKEPQIDVLEDEIMDKKIKKEKKKSKKKDKKKKKKRKRERNQDKKRSRDLKRLYNI